VSVSVLRLTLNIEEDNIITSIRVLPAESLTENFGNSTSSCGFPCIYSLRRIVALEHFEIISLNMYITNLKSSGQKSQ
jgi:hypothetical protein